MNKRSMTILIALAIALWAPLALAQDTVESIEKAVTEQWNKLNSMSANLAANAEIKLNPESPPLKPVGGGTASYLKKGETPMYLIEGWAGLTPAAKLAQAKCLYDGKETFLDTLWMGKVQSQKPAMAVAPGGKALFDFLNQNLTLTAKPVEKIGDKDAYVLEAVLKEVDEKIPVGKINLYFDKATGVPLRIQAFDKQGVPNVTINVTDVQINPTISEDAFKYVPFAPPTPPAPPPSAAPAAPAPPAPAAPKK